MYIYFSFAAKGFFESAEGKPYAPVLKIIRWNHVLTTLDATRDLISDRIVPEGNCISFCTVPSCPTEWAYIRSTDPVCFIPRTAVCRASP